MGEAKRIEVKPISAQDANRIVRATHYSGKVVNNSQLHFGVFMDGRCGGAMQFGPSLDKRKLQGLVERTGWNEFIELNRMAFADWLPRNSESRALGVAFRLMRKAYPHLKWVVSFADAAQCGDGTIYRASGFVLTGIRRNNSIWAIPEDGESGPRFSRTALTDQTSTAQKILALSHGSTGDRTTVTKGRHTIADVTVKSRPQSCDGSNGAASMKRYYAMGYRPIPGFQLRYVCFLDPTARERLTVPIIPFSRIAEVGAGMYKGKLRAGSIVADATANHAGEGGSIPTPALQTLVELTK